MLLPRMGRRDDQAGARDPHGCGLADHDWLLHADAPLSDSEHDAAPPDGHAHLDVDSHGDDPADQFLHTVPAADLYVYPVPDSNQYPDPDRDQDANLNAE